MFENNKSTTCSYILSFLKFKILAFILQGNTCKDTIITLQKVENCPESDTNVQERSKKKNCDSYSQCEGEPLTYHCARYKEYLVEVCTPIKFIRGV